MTEELMKVYDKDKGQYFDVRNLVIQSIDSTTYYQDQIRFTRISKKKKLNDMWKLFWFFKFNKNQQLLEAAMKGDVKRIKKLCIRLFKKPEKVAELNFYNSNGYTAFHLATLHNQYEALTLFLQIPELNIDLLTQDRLKMTALHIACKHQHMLIVRLLIEEYKANINLQDSLGNTPMHYACDNGNFRLVKILLRRKPNIEIRNYKKLTPSQLTAKADIIKELNKYAQKDESTMKSNSNSKMSVGDISDYQSTEHVADKRQVDQQGLTNSSCKNQNEKSIDIVEEINRLTQKHEAKVEQMSIEHQSKSSIKSHSLKSSLANDKSEDFLQDYFNKVKQAEQIKKKIKKYTTEEDSVQLQPENQSLQLATTYQINNFVPVAKLGSGSFGNVYLVEEVGTQKQFAMKVLLKKRIFEDQLLPQTVTERNILAKVKHPFIVELQAAFQTTDKLFLVLEYCPCGDMGSILKRQRRFPEELARIYICEVLLAIEYLHSEGVIYRDLKPENIIIDDKGHVKLTDFGLSKENIDDDYHSTSFIGSHAYLAPEVIKQQPHGKSIDWYGLGALLYEFLVGVPPYIATDLDTLYNNIKQGPLKIPKILSPVAVDLIKKLLERNPMNRLGVNGAQEIKNHLFFNQVDWEDIINKKTFPSVHKLKQVKKQQIPIQQFLENTKIVSEVMKKKMRVLGWSFTRSNNQ